MLQYNAMDCMVPTIYSWLVMAIGIIIGTTIATAGLASYSYTCIAVYSYRCVTLEITL